MGLTGLHLEVLVREANQRPFTGRAVTCGVLDSNITFASLYRRASDAGVKLRKNQPRLSPNPSQFPGGCLHSACVLEALGFGEVAAMDASDFEGAEILLDLNQAETPKELVGTADLVLEAGTLEHVFHVPHAMRHLVRIVKPGGRILHTSPASNFIDHGFYCFSPTFFFDFYRQNGFRIETLEVWRYGENADRAYRLPYIDERGEPVRYAEAGADVRSWLPVELGDSGSRKSWDVYGVVCVATKTQDTPPVIPQQHEYSIGQWSSQAPSFHLAVSKAMEFARRGNAQALRQHLDWMAQVFSSEKGSWLSAFQGEVRLLEKKELLDREVRPEAVPDLLPLVVQANSLSRSKNQEALSAFVDHLPRLPGAMDEYFRWTLGFPFRDRDLGQGKTGQGGGKGRGWWWILAVLSAAGSAVYFLRQHF